MTVRGRYASWRRPYGYYRVMARSRRGIVYATELEGSVVYLLRLLSQRRHMKHSIVGRCWIEKNLEPATT
jgi:hypothetical protein